MRKISTTTHTFYLADTTTGNIYSCCCRLTGNMVSMTSMWGSDRLELGRRELQRAIKTGVFKRVGVDY